MVLGADVVREMGISASRTGDGSRPPKERSRVRPLGRGEVERRELVGGGVGVGDGDGECEFGLRGEGVRGKEEERCLACVLVFLGNKGRGAANIIQQRWQRMTNVMAEGSSSKPLQLGGMIELLGTYEGDNAAVYRYCTVISTVHISDSESLRRLGEELVANRILIGGKQSACMERWVERDWADVNESS